MRIRRSATIVLAAFGLAAAAVSGYHSHERQQQARTAQEHRRALAQADSLAESGNLREALQVYDRLAKSLAGDGAAALFGLVSRRRAAIHLQLASSETPAKHLSAAVRDLESALAASGEDPAPEGTAEIHRQLADAYRMLGTLTDPLKNLPPSIRHYKKALEHFGPTRPEAYAALCKGMALAHRQLAEYESPEKNLNDAMEGFRRAMTVYGPQSHPFEHAVARNNLGAMEMTLAEANDRRQRLEAAVDHFSAALNGFSAGGHRLDAAFAASNLGLAHAGLSQIADRRRHLARALAAFDDAKSLLPPGSHPKLIAVIDQNRLRVENALDAPPPASSTGPPPAQNTP